MLALAPDTQALVMLAQGPGMQAQGLVTHTLASGLLTRALALVMLAQGLVK